MQRVALRARVRSGSVPLLAGWLVAGSALSLLTTRVVSWRVMTDELLYERLAISIDHLHSPLPSVHGVLISNTSQLYPLLLAIAYAHGSTVEALESAKVLNAFVMSSAGIPAFLLARRVTGSRPAAALVGLLTVCIPWIACSALLLTEVAAYPAFVWALLAFHRSATERSRSADALALGGLVLAVAARTEFLTLVVAFPLALVVHELAFAPGRGAGRARAAARELLVGHRLLAWAYLALVLAGAGLAAAGRLSSALGIYGTVAHGGLLPPRDFVSSLLQGTAIVSLALGVLPFILGLAWPLGLLARPAGRRREHAMAAIGTIVGVCVLLEATDYDVRFGGGVVHDRYLFYLAPLVLVGFAAALCDRRAPRWSLLPAGAVVAAGFAVAPLAASTTFSIDSPLSEIVALLQRELGSPATVRTVLAVGSAVAVVLFVEGSVLLPRSLLAGLLVALPLAVAPAETGYVLAQLLSARDVTGRPITKSPGPDLDWIDRRVGSGTNVTELPYPGVSGYPQLSTAAWWDLEFWNRSVDREALDNGEYGLTPSSFPKLLLHVDPETGFANISPTRYVAQSDHETRVQIAGSAIASANNILLIDAGKRWRAAWLSFGLTASGSTRPGRTATIRVFPYLGQRAPVVRTLTLEVQTRQPFLASSNLASWRQGPTSGVTSHALELCVPARGYGEVRIRTGARAGKGGVSIAVIAVANELGGTCRPAKPGG